MDESGTAAAAARVPVGELLLLDRVPAAWRPLAAAVAVVTAVAVAILMETLHRHFQSIVAGGGTVGPIGLLLANGSSPGTVWPGWTAALFFAIALHRLRNGSPEPPAGRGDAAARSVSELRSALRSEYLTVRIALIAVAWIALTDSFRAVLTLVLAHGDGTGAGAVVATALEAFGLVTASCLLGLWGRAFRTQLAQWGA
jgi:hypothetical protein